MTDREKLIELIGQVQYMGGLELALADKLIANGVTIPVRCKDCTSGKGSTYKVCPLYKQGLMKDNDYCSVGERRTE